MNTIFRKTCYKYWSIPLLCILLFACESESRFRIQQENLLEINKDRAVVPVGQTLQLTADAFVNGNINPSIKWSSDDEEVATVNEDSGLVEGEAVGEVTITAIAEDDPTLTDSIAIEVVEPVTSLVLTIEDSVDIQNGTVPNGTDPKDMDVAQMEIGLSRDLKVTLNPQIATNKEIDLAFDDESIATIENMETDEDGNITFTVRGQITGETTLRAAAQDGFGSTDEIQIKVTQDHYVITLQGDPNFLIAPVIDDSEAQNLLEYNYDVDWNNDGIFEEFDLTGLSPSPPFTDGIHTIRIAGRYPNPGLDRDAGVNLNIISVDQWGTQQWLSMFGSFTNYLNVDIKATDIPDLSQVRSMQSMFSGATSANPDVSQWDVSNVADMSEIFSGATSANPDVSQWNIGSVTDFFKMTNIFNCSGIDVENYEGALINFSEQVNNGTAIENINLGDIPVGVESQEGIDAKNSLIEANWVITDEIVCP